MRDIKHEFPPYLQVQVAMGESGTDILHGELKNRMVEAEEHLATAIQKEKDTDYGDAMDSMDRTYAEGYLDALVSVYQLTYDLAFAIGARNEHNR